MREVANMLQDWMDPLVVSLLRTAEVVETLDHKQAGLGRSGIRLDLTFPESAEVCCVCLSQFGTFRKSQASQM